MAVQLNRWKCEVCGAAFAQREEAECCEKKHIHIVGIQSQHYSLRSIAPTSMKVIGSDGREYRYELAVC